MEKQICRGIFFIHNMIIVRLDQKKNWNHIFRAETQRIHKKISITEIIVFLLTD